jgi:hypothetical protein
MLWLSGEAKIAAIDRANGVHEQLKINLSEPLFTHNRLVETK